MRVRQKSEAKTLEAEITAKMRSNDIIRAQRRNVVEQMNRQLHPQQRELQRRMHERMDAHIANEIKTGQLKEYQWQAMQKHWDNIIRDPQISHDTALSILQMEPEKIQQILRRQISLTELDQLITDRQQFKALLFHQLHLMREDRELFEKSYQRFEELLQSRTAEVRAVILSLNRRDMRDLLLLRKSVLQIEDLRADKPILQENERTLLREATLVLHMMRVKPEEIQVYRYNLGRVREEFANNAEDRETLQRILQLNQVAIFELLLNRVEPHDLMQYFTPKEIVRIQKAVQPFRPTEAQLSAMPQEMRERVQKTLHDWDRKYAESSVQMEKAGTSMETWWNSVLTGLLKDGSQDYHGARAQMLELAEENPFALERLQMLFYDLRTPEKFALKELNDKLGEIQQIVAPEYFIPIALQVVPKPLDGFNQVDNGLPTLSDVIYSQKGLDPYTTPGLGKHFAYNVPFHFEHGNLKLIAQSGGGKTTIIQQLLRMASQPTMLNGEYHKEAVRRELRRMLIADAKGELHGRKIPKLRSRVILDPKGGELSRETIQELIEMGYEVDVISYDDFVKGLLENPLADVPTVNGITRDLDARIASAEQMVEKRKQENTGSKTDVDSYNRALDALEALKKRKAAALAPEEIQARIKDQHEAANEFVRLWMIGLSLNAVNNASILTDVNKGMVTDALTAAVIASREIDPHAPLYHLREIVRDRKSFLDAINRSGSETAKRLIEAILKLEERDSNRLFSLLYECTKSIKKADNRRLTSGDEFPTRRLLKGGVVLFVQCDYQRMLEQDLVPLLSTEIGMMKYTIEKTKIARIKAGQFPGADVDFVWEEYPKFALWAELQKKLGIARAPAGTFDWVLFQEKAQIDDEVDALISHAIYAYISQRQAQELAPLLGVHHVWYRSVGTSLAEAHEQQYRRNEPTIGWNATNTDVYQNAFSREHSEGYQQTLEPLFTPQQLEQIMSEKGVVLYMQNGMKPMFVRVPMANDPRRPISFGSDYKQPVVIRTGRIREHGEDTWGRELGQHTILPPKPGDLDPLTPDAVKKMSSEQNIESDIGIRHDKMEQLNTYVTEMTYYKNSASYYEEVMKNKKDGTLEADRRRERERAEIEAAMATKIRDAEDKRSRYEREIELLEARQQALRAAPKPLP